MAPVDGLQTNRCSVRLCDDLDQISRRTMIWTRANWRTMRAHAVSLPRESRAPAVGTDRGCFTAANRLITQTVVNLATDGAIHRVFHTQAALEKRLPARICG
jgi:hypothetical protein